MMGKQTIAIRGHQDEDSNFMVMLSLLAKENSVLHDNLENTPQSIHVWMSRTRSSFFQQSRFSMA